MIADAPREERSQESVQAIDVLLVEDDPGDVLMTREAFEERHVADRLHVVSDGVLAMQFLRRTDSFATVPRPGLILLDLNLPRRNGLEVLAELKADQSLHSIPVVVLTSSQSEQDILRSYSLHASAFVTKPPSGFSMPFVRSTVSSCRWPSSRTDRGGGRTARSLRS